MAYLPMKMAKRAVVAPDAVIKALLGWSNEGMLNNYGGEPAIDVKRKWLEKALT